MKNGVGSAEISTFRKTIVIGVVVRRRDFQNWLRKLKKTKGLVKGRSLGRSEEESRLQERESIWQRVETLKASTWMV